MNRQEKEKALRRWFAMWLKGKDLGISRLFAPQAVYTESWGPQYRGADKIKHWFDEWNTRGKVLQWDIKQFFHQGSQTVVQWYFKNRLQNGQSEEFEGISLIVWNKRGQIMSLTEYGCNIHRYDPYQNGPVPVFRQDKSRWF